MVQRPVLVTVLLGAAFGVIGATAIGLRSVRVEQQRILYYSREYLRHSEYLQGRSGDSIVTWGWRVLEFPLNSGNYKERVAEDPKTRFSNGSLAMDVNGDGDQELIISKYERENWKGHEFLWYERVPGQTAWREHKIGYIEAPGKEMPHDMQAFSMRLPDGTRLESFVLVIGRVDIYLFEKPADPRGPWKRYDIAHLPDPPQSGMQIADINGDGRPDIVAGMFWVECPEDPRIGVWKFHRYGEWDKQHKPWGGMNKHAVADFDGDGSLEIIADEAENPGSKLIAYKRDPKNPNGLWNSTVIDTNLYCPHTMATADINADGRPDILVGEMDAGGWEVPMTPNPKIYAYLNQGNLQFQKVVLAQGYGIHEGKLAPKPYEGRLLLYGNSTTQPGLDGMITNLSTYTLESVSTVDRTSMIFHDDFIGRLDTGWSWVREQPGTWRVGTNELSVRTLSGTLWGTTNTAQNLLLRPAPESGPWKAEVRVMIHASMDGEQAGLLYYADDDNYVKLVKEYKDRSYAILVRERDHQGETVGRLPISGDLVELQLAISDGVLRASMREGTAGSWQLIGECEAPSGRHRIGMFTHVDPGQTDRWAQFTRFQILRLKTLASGFAEN